MVAICHIFRLGGHFYELVKWVKQLDEGSVTNTLMHIKQILLLLLLETV